MAVNPMNENNRGLSIGRDDITHIILSIVGFLLVAFFGLVCWLGKEQWDLSKSTHDIVIVHGVAFEGISNHLDRIDMRIDKLSEKVGLPSSAILCNTNVPLASHFNPKDSIGIPEN
jgi:hypothetical protein